MEQHFTVTGYVVHGGRTLLHHHHKLQMWLPPGGHIEPDEDPVQAVLSEIEEETGLRTALLPHEPLVDGFTAPAQIAPPVTILIEDIDEPDRPHQHIDLIYFTQPLGNATLDPSHGDIWRWTTPGELKQAAIDGVAEGAIIAEDVRKLALLAIERASTLASAR